MDRGLAQTFLQRRDTNGHQVQEKLLNIIVIWEIQINIKWDHFTHTRMGIIFLKENNMLLRRNRYPCTLLNCKMVQPLWQTVWHIEKVKQELPYNPEIPLLVYNQKIGKWVLKRILFHECSQKQYWRQPKCGNRPNVHQWTNG